MAMGFKKKGYRQVQLSYICKLFLPSIIIVKSLLKIAKLIFQSLHVFYELVEQMWHLGKIWRISGS